MWKSVELAPRTAPRRTSPHRIAFEFEWCKERWQWVVVCCTKEVEVHLWSGSDLHIRFVCLRLINCKPSMQQMKAAVDGSVQSGGGVCSVVHPDDPNRVVRHFKQKGSVSPPLNLSPFFVESCEFDLLYFYYCLRCQWITSYLCESHHHNLHH